MVCQLSSLPGGGMVTDSTKPGITRRELLSGGVVVTAGFCFNTSMNAATSTHDVLELSLVQLVAAVKSGKLSAADYVEALLVRNAAKQQLNAYIHQDPARLSAAAKTIDEQISGGADPGPLAGAPLALKDNIDVAGYPTTAGTPALAQWQPPSSAPVAAAVLDAGALLAGKANMHELAVGITSNNAHFGPARNPYNPAMIPGGSSGGTAVAIAARLAVAGLGSDTGGSCRIPAALCGVVGFRPTLHRYSQVGIVPISSTRDTPGPFARTVEDVMLLDSVCAVRKQPREQISLKGLRLGVPRKYFYEDLDPELAPVAEAALEALRDAGVVLIEADLADVGTLNDQAGMAVAMYEQSRELGAYLNRADSGITAREVISQIAGPMERERLLAQLDPATAVSSEMYQAAIGVHRPALQRAYAEYFEAHNVAALVVPTTPLPARPIGQDETVELNGKQVPTFLTFIRNTDSQSVAGLPGLSVPAALTAGGLPVGMEFVGPANTDARVLAIGEGYETLRPALPAPV